jgi:hypothetical protein
MFLVKDFIIHRRAAEDAEFNNFLLSARKTSPRSLRLCGDQLQCNSLKILTYCPVSELSTPKHRKVVATSYLLSANGRKVPPLVKSLTHIIGKVHKAI